MKYFYSLFVFVLFGGILNAQSTFQADTGSVPSRPGLSADNLYERATPFYTEDFSGGFPSGWSLNDSSGICPWRWSLDGSWGYYSTTGASSGDNPISSTTGSNGFLICDPDSANNANYGQPSGTTYQYLSTMLKPGQLIVLHILL